MTGIEEEVKHRFENEKHRLLFNIVFTGGWITGNFSKVIKPYGISSQQFNILRILRGAGVWLTMNEVKRRMVEKSPNATRLCDKLLEKEYVERRRSEEDRRVVHLKISKQGLELLSRMDNEIDPSHMSYLENVSEEEATLVADILDRLRS